MMEIVDIPPVNALYVGDLNINVTESMLFSKFAAVGPVKSVRICKDSITKKSLGYAYVNFESPDDAERALDILNWEILNDKPMRIMWSQRDPSLRKSGAGNIFIKNLDKSIDSKSLYDTFSAFGHIVSCKIAPDEEGRSKGYGFIQFETEKDAQTAIEKVDGMLICGKKVYVGKFKSKRERENEVGEKIDNFTNVFVKNFGETLDETKLYELFSKFGKIKSHVIMKSEDGTSKGFGFVDFEDAFAAKASVLELNNMEVAGRALFVGRALKRGERKKSENSTCVQGVNLYVKHLDDSIDDDSLRLLFDPFGTITSAKVMKYDNNRSKGFGFVCFSSPEEATRAITKMNKRYIVSKPLYVALAQSKDDRKIQVTTNFVKFINSFHQMFQFNEPYNMSAVGHPQRDFQPNIASIQARWPHPLFQNHNVTQTVDVAHAPSPMYPVTRHNRGQTSGPNSFRGNLRSFAARNFGSASMIRSSRSISQANPTRSNTIAVSNSRPPTSSTLPENISSSIRSSGVNTLPNQPSCIPKPVAHQYLQKQQESSSLSSFTEHIRPQTVTNQDIAYEPLTTEPSVTSHSSANQVIASKPSSMQEKFEFPIVATYRAPTSRYSANQVIASRPSSMQQAIAFPHSKTCQATTSHHSENLLLSSRPSIIPQTIAFPHSVLPATTSLLENQVIPSRLSTMLQDFEFPPLTTQQDIEFPPLTTQQDIEFPPLTKATSSYPSEAITSCTQEPLTTSILANITLQERKLMLGERLFPHVKKLYPEVASKITGMLLEIDNDNLLHLLEDPNLIKEKANDAFSVLKAYRTTV